MPPKKYTSYHSIKIAKTVDIIEIINMIDAAFILTFTGRRHMLITLDYEYEVMFLI